MSTDTESSIETPSITITIRVRKGWSAERNAPIVESVKFEVVCREEERTVRAMVLKDTSGEYPIPEDEFYRDTIREAVRLAFKKPVSWL